MRASSLFDNFNDNNIEPTKWSTSVASGGTVAETGGKIVCTVVASTVSDAQINSLSTRKLDLISSYVQAKVTPSAGTTVDTAFKIIRDGSNAVYFLLSTTTIQARKLVATVDSLVATAAYNSTNHAYLRIRESLGTIYFDTSPEGLVWTNFATLANPFALDNVQFQFDVNEYAIDAAATNGTLDDFNIALSFIPNVGTKLRPHQFSPGRAR